MQIAVARWASPRHQRCPRAAVDNHEQSHDDAHDCNDAQRVPKAPRATVGKRPWLEASFTAVPFGRTVPQSNGSDHHNRCRHHGNKMHDLPKPKRRWLDQRLIYVQLEGLVGHDPKVPPTSCIGKRPIGIHPDPEISPAYVPITGGAAAAAGGMLLSG